MNSPNQRPRPFEEQIPDNEDSAPAGPTQFSAAHLHGSPPLHDTSGEPQFAPDAPPLHDHGRDDDFARSDNFDPVWTGQGDVTERSAAVTQADLDRIEEILSSEHFRIRRKRAERNEFVPPPPPPAETAKKSNALVWAAGTFVLLVATSAFIAYQTTERVPLFDGASDAGGVMSRVASMFGTQQPEQTQASAPAAPPPLPTRAAAPTPPPGVKPHLVVNGASADSPDRILVGVAAEGASDGMTAVIGGLVPGTTLTAGEAWGSTGWIVPAAELATTYLRPPAGFSGAMEYSVSLHRADNSVIDRQTMRLEWNPQQAANPPLAEQPTQAEQSQLQQPAPRQQAEMRRLPTEEVDALLKRGEALMMEGDIASARLLLQRAADAQDARAAFALAATYDPIELKRLGVYGAVPDVTRARDWYEKAKLYGSREAPRRLELLASQFR